MEGLGRGSEASSWFAAWLFLCVERWLGRGKEIGHQSGVGCIGDWTGLGGS